VVGESVEDAVRRAAVLEKVAFLASHAPDAEPAPSALVELHHGRKHGANRRYGQ
jgi:ribulose-5-phosphate 4-epimerase/fuculose-1-phosphate aldolase